MLVDDVVLINRVRVVAGFEIDHFNERWRETSRDEGFEIGYLHGRWILRLVGVIVAATDDVLGNFDARSIELRQAVVTKAVTPAEIPPDREGAECMCGSICIQ